ncbi:MAG: hypothetical protein M1556_01415 [Candidatus Thermoplasmatota archaeon]|jgi:hypothetical protein|nr:hypothetical protein [Candidatus Thermoplasmatota archaeon]MCL6002294.1 hypothetical protein [Candidatus Thermoplasmatota archaeon]
MSQELIHLIDSPFRSRKSKYFTVFGSERTFDLLISNKFYPTILPASGKLISLTVTTENLENKFDYIQKSYNKIITANLSQTNEIDNFVTYGKFSTYEVSDRVYSVYLDSLNLNILSTPPLVIEKEIEGKKNNEIIGKTRHFQWASYSRYGKDSIDATFNIIIVNFPRTNLRYSGHTIINFRGQELLVSSIFAKMLVSGRDGNFSFVFVKLVFDPSLFNEILRNDLVACVLQVYTLYNIKDGNKDIQPINYVTAVVPFFGSYEELIPFFCNQFSEEGYSRKCIVDKKIMEKLRFQILEGSRTEDKEVHLESNVYSLREHQECFEYSILRPESILRFIEGAVSSDLGRSILENTVSDGDIKQEAQHLVEQLKNSSFINGTLINPGLKRSILEAFKV